jgi:hypothetical protein
MIAFRVIVASMIVGLSVMTGCKESSATVDPPKITPPYIKECKRLQCI